MPRALLENIIHQPVRCSNIYLLKGRDVCRFLIDYDTYSGDNFHDYWQKDKTMSYITISNWTADEWNDEMEAVARDKFQPMVMAMGASGVQFVRTGALTMSVVTHYPDEAAATAAQAKIAAIRAQAAGELPIKMDTSVGGSVFTSA